jgi:aerobic-type carbon monoxide dehydrogenase small subunit (CoxS/CutS family)
MGTISYRRARLPDGLITKVDRVQPDALVVLEPRTISQETGGRVMAVEFTLNDTKRSVPGDEQRSLLEVLREDLGLTGTKYGCGVGDCRACTVLVDGEALPSCRLDLADVRGKEVRTIEGLSRDGQLHAVQRAFLEAGAMQCGYCVPGMVLTAVALLEDNPGPSEEDIVSAMNGNLCRCCGYVSILDAVRRAAARKEGAQ